MTSIGFAMSPIANTIAISVYRRASGCRTHRTYVAIVSIQNNVLRTSFRSEIHATDSTCSG